MSRFKSPTQPLCRCCGKPLGKWTTIVYVKSEPTKYDVEASYCRYVYVGLDTLKTKADCQRHSNQHVVSVKYWTETENGEPLPETRRVSSFNEWDGESYTDELFCTNTCAQDFGRLAARNTKLQTVAYADAIKRRHEKKAATG